MSGKTLGNIPQSISECSLVGCEGRPEMGFRPAIESRTQRRVHRPPSLVAPKISSAGQNVRFAPWTIRRRQSGNSLCVSRCTPSQYANVRSFLPALIFIRGRGGYCGRSGEVARLGSASTLTILEIYLLSSCRVVRERSA
jgi:hypothetical protein